jgi:IS30 family transposase
MPRRLLIRYWTPEDDAELEGLLRVGTSVTEIAVKLKRSRKTIQSRARKLQLAASAGRAGRA